MKLLKKLERFVGICINSGKRLEKYETPLGGREGGVIHCIKSKYNMPQARAQVAGNAP